MFRRTLKLAGLFLAGLVFVLPPATASELKDPTRPPLVHRKAAGEVAPPKKKKVWKLNSTLISPVRRSAVVNGKRVVVGGKVDGAVCLNIEPARVRLKKNGRPIVLTLSTKKLKKTPRAEGP